MLSDVKASTKYLEELSRQLRSQGLTVHPRESRDIDVELDGSTLCRINDLGNLGYFADKIAGKEAILDRIRDMARSTREYMTLLEQAPPLKADGLEDGYQLLAEFNGTVLAGHMTRYGAQFVTWEWVRNKTSLWQGHYYDPNGHPDSYQSAKRDFAVRSGLLPACALFKQEQLAEIYRSIHETLDGDIPLTDERRKALESAVGQIEEGVPDLEERVAVSAGRERELSLQLDRANTLGGMGGVSL